jgi:hypothetical protein
MDRVASLSRPQRHHTTDETSSLGGSSNNHSTSSRPLRVHGKTKKYLDTAFSDTDDDDDDVRQISASRKNGQNAAKPSTTQLSSKPNDIRGNNLHIRNGKHHGNKNKNPSVDLSMSSDAEDEKMDPTAHIGTVKNDGKAKKKKKSINPTMPFLGEEDNDEYAPGSSKSPFLDRLKPQVSKDKDESRRTNDVSNRPSQNDPQSHLSSNRQPVPRKKKAIDTTMPSFDDEDDEIGGESSSNNKRSAALGDRKKKNLSDACMPFTDIGGASDSVPRSNDHNGGKAHNGWQIKNRNPGLKDMSSSFEDESSAKHTPEGCIGLSRVLKKRSRLLHGSKENKRINKDPWSHKLRSPENASRVYDLSTSSSSDSDNDGARKRTGHSKTKASASNEKTSCRILTSSEKRRRRAILSSSSSEGDEDRQGGRKQQRAAAISTPWSPDCEVDSPPPSCILVKKAILDSGERSVFDFSSQDANGDDDDASKKRAAWSTQKKKRRILESTTKTKSLRLVHH